MVFDQVYTLLVIGQTGSNLMHMSLLFRRDALFAPIAPFTARIDLPRSLLQNLEHS